MLFRINKRNNLVMVPEAAKLTDHCKKLTEEELRFVILATDYYSPLRQYPKKEKLQKAKRMVWGKDDKDKFFPEDDKKIAAAIEEYGELQYDQTRETIAAYQEKIEMLMVQLLQTNTAGSVSKIDADISTLQIRIKALQEDVERLEDNVKLKGKDDKLSLIEIWQRNQIKAKKDKGKIRKLEQEQENG
jgi:hypothetical protein